MLSPSLRCGRITIGHNTLKNDEEAGSESRGDEMIEGW